MREQGAAPTGAASFFALPEAEDAVGQRLVDKDEVRPFPILRGVLNREYLVARQIERYQDHTKKSPEGGPGVSVAFFQMIYQILIGQERGPRFGSFAALYGTDNTRALIAQALAGELVA